MLRRKEKDPHQFFICEWSHGYFICSIHKAQFESTTRWKRMVVTQTFSYCICFSLLGFIFTTRIVHKLAFLMVVSILFVLGKFQKIIECKTFSCARLFALSKQSSGEDIDIHVCPIGLLFFLWVLFGKVGMLVIVVVVFMMTVC